jgi:tetratricopeptide (TPR) repeat protein
MIGAAVFVQAMTLLPRFMLLTLALGLGSPSHAAWLRDDHLQRLWEQGRRDDLHLVTQSLKSADAYAAQAMLASDMNDKAATERSLRLAEACVKQYPDAANCHYVLGTALSAKAIQGGMLQAMRLGGRVFEAWETALRLDPGLFEARIILQQTYLLLPGMAGGSVPKAEALEAAVRSTQPEVAKLLRANLAAKKERWDEAERELMAVQWGDDLSFHTQALGVWQGLLRHWLKVNDHARARQRMEHLMQVLPYSAVPVFSLGRVAADEGKHEEAIRWYERARALQGAASLPIDYRQGLAYWDLGDKDRARALLQRFVQTPRVAPNNLKDAKSRLKDLG